MPALKYRTTIPKPDDPDIYESICAAIELGHPQASAAYQAGIHEDTLFHWRYQGQDELKALDGIWKPWEELGPHAQLVIRIKEAEAAFVGDALANWRTAPKDWARWATLLERRQPAHFGKQSPDAKPPVLAVGHVTIQLPAEAMAYFVTQGQSLLEAQSALPPPSE